MIKGFIKLHRELSDKDFWLAEPMTRGQAWVDLLMRVSYAPTHVIIRGVRIDLDPGQVAFSERHYEKRWKLSRGKIRRILDRWAMDERIEVDRTNVVTVVTVLNWDDFQINTKNGTTDRTTERTGNETTERTGNETTERTTDLSTGTASRDNQDRTTERTGNETTKRTGNETTERNQGRTTNRTTEKPIQESNKNTRSKEIHQPPARVREDDSLINATSEWTIADYIKATQSLIPGFHAIPADVIAVAIRQQSDREIRASGWNEFALDVLGSLEPIKSPGKMLRKYMQFADRNGSGRNAAGNTRSGGIGAALAKKLGIKS